MSPFYHYGIRIIPSEYCDSFRQGNGYEQTYTHVDLIGIRFSHLT